MTTAYARTTDRPGTAAKRERAVVLRRQGMSMAAIGRVLGMTRQAVHQLLASVELPVRMLVKRGFATGGPVVGSRWGGRVGSYDAIVDGIKADGVYYSPVEVELCMAGL
jgi:hypothetical protein